jgi:hypothetical protein
MSEYEKLATCIGSRAHRHVVWSKFRISSQRAKGDYKNKHGPIYIFHNICRMIAIKFSGTNIKSKDEYRKLSFETGLSQNDLQKLEMEVLEAIDWRIM